MLADLDVRDRRIDGSVIAAWLFLAVAPALGVERINVRRASPQPDEDARIGLAAYALLIAGFRSQAGPTLSYSNGGSGCTACFQKITACPSVLFHVRLSFSHDKQFAPARLIPMRFQDEPKTRRTLSLWRGANEAHIRSDMQRVSNEARGSKDQRIRLILKAHWNKAITGLQRCHHFTESK